MLQHPVVQGTIILKLKRAQRVGYPLNGVRQRMREVVHGVYAPRVAGIVMCLVPNAIQRRIAKMNIRRRHVDLGAQNARTFREFAVSHSGEKIEIFIRAALAKRAI